MNPETNNIHALSDGTVVSMAFSSPEYVQYLRPIYIQKQPKT